MPQLANLSRFSIVNEGREELQTLEERLDEKYKLLHEKN